MKKWSFLALLLLGSAILGGTVLREPIASAAQSVSATIIGPLDGQGNVAVHEQGTADVNVTNASLPSSANRLILAAEDFHFSVSGSATPWFDTSDCRHVQAVVRHMTPDVVVRLLATASPSGDEPSDEDVDAIYAPSEIVEGAPPAPHKATYYFATDEGRLAAAPAMSLKFSTAATLQGVVDTAWLYCIA
jgi:hypothetical protein